MEIGMIGAFFIMAAWVYEAYQTYKKGQKLDTRFILFYIIGLAMLTYYSYEIDDAPFLLLNGSILVLSIVELLLNLRRK